MRILVRAMCFAAALGALTLAAGAHSHHHKLLQVVHPSTTASEAGPHPGELMATIQMKIRNRSERSDRLIRAVTPVADHVEIVTARRSPQADTTSIIVATGQVDLAANGDHIRLRGLKKRLEPYDTFEMTLVFERAGAMKIEVQVED